MTGSKSRVLRGLFVNEQGLRAGWSVLIFLAIVVVLIGVRRHAGRALLPGRRHACGVAGYPNPG